MILQNVHNHMNGSSFIHAYDSFKIAISCIAIKISVPKPKNADCSMN